MHSRTMRPATEPGSGCRLPTAVLRAAALLVGFLSASGDACAQTYIDLTTELSQAPEGPSFGPGVGSGAHAVKRALPIEAVLQDLYPVAVEATDRVTALIVIRNVGKESLDVPVARDLAILKAGNLDQRWLDVRLAITLPAPLEPIALLVGTLVGSRGVPGSLLALAPREYVTLRVRTSLSETAKWHYGGLDTARVTIRAKVVESYFDSKEFSLTSDSLPVFSRNEVEIFWHH